MHSPEKIQPPLTPAYRADIDGLRAISIILVVGYHARPALIPGGFIGVDIFFVISGFLITRIIGAKMKAGTFSFLDFYARRVRRIFPALIVVLAATYLIGWFVLLPEAFALLGRSIAAGVAFVSNLFQLTQIGYFAPDAAENPLLHLWSLGIEEQFYIFWPPILLMLSRSKRRQFWMAGIAAASFSISLLIFFGYKEWSFYSPIPRAWELLAGGIVACRYIEGSEPKPPDQLANILAAAGIAAIIGAGIGLNEHSSFPGLYALLPVLGAVLMIVSPNSHMNRILLSNRAMVWIGLISYPLYLWHWPLLSYLTTLRNGNPNELDIWAVVVVAITLSWLTYRFVEIPVRRRENAVPSLSFALIAVGIAGMVTAIASGFDFRFSPEIRDIARLASINNAGFRDKCFLVRASQFQSDCVEPGEKPLLFVWGDSTAAALFPGLRKAQEAGRFRLARFSTPGCAPILATGTNILASDTDTKCDDANSVVFGFLKSSAPSIVLLHARWDVKDDLGKLRETISQLQALHIRRIVILGPLPVWKRGLPLSLVNFYRVRHVVADRIATGVSGPEMDQRMEDFSRKASVEYISAWHTLCDAAGCMTRAGPAASDVLITDDVHLSDAGSRFFMEAIANRLLAGQ